VDSKTETSAIEAAFDRFTSERKDVAIVLINQHVCVASSACSFSYVRTLLRRAFPFTVSPASVSEGFLLGETPSLRRVCFLSSVDLNPLPLRSGVVVAPQWSIPTNGTDGTDEEGCGRGKE
jgi:hypothetical protein